MKQIDVGRGMYALVDDSDFAELSKYKWTTQKGKHTFYAKRMESGSLILMHRQILGLSDRLEFCDHKDGDGLNNQRENLRKCTAQENNMNKRGYKNSKSKLKGIKRAFRKKAGDVWRVRIMAKGSLFYLGTFKTEEDAIHAYNEKAKELHGEFARLNDV